MSPLEQLPDAKKNRGEAPLPSVTITTARLRKAVERIGLHSLIQSFDPAFLLEMERRKRDEQTWTGDRLVEDALKSFRSLIRQQGADILESDIGFELRNIGYRFVSAQSKEEMDAILANANMHGGEHPLKKLAGLCIDYDGYYVGKQFLKNDLHRMGILFVYDLRKLQKLDETEKASHTHFVAGYGMKPKEGFSYRDTLLGAIRVEPS